MNRIIIIILTLISMLWLGQAEAYTVKSVYPENFGVGLPITTEIAIELDVPINMAGVSFSVSPNVAGSITTEECGVLSYKYTPGLRYKLTKCFRIRFTPETYLKPDILYTVEVKNGEFGPPFVWSFRTGTMSVSEEYVIETSNVGYPKPATGICPQGAVLVWQEKEVGILAQLFDENEQPLGSEILIAGPRFYSPYIAPSVAMDLNCNWLVGYQDDYPRKKELKINYRVNRYDFQGNPLPSPDPIIYYLQEGVVDNWSLYPMQRDIGGIRVATTPSGKYFAAVYQVPMCFRQCKGNCIRPPYKCDNFIMGKLFDSDAKVVADLGDENETRAGGNKLAPFAVKIINDVPYMDDDYNTRDLGGGCGVDCAYHPEMCMSETRIAVVWPEFYGTNGGFPELANRDDIQIRVFEVPTGNSLTDEKRANILQGTRYDQWSPSCDATDSGYITADWVARYLTNVPRAERAKRETDVYARIMDPSGKWLTKVEFLVNDPSNTANEQFSPGVEMDEQSETLRFFWLANGTGGMGVHTKQFDFDGNALTSEARLNPFNDSLLNMEMEKRYTSADTAHKVWSYNIGKDCRSGKCFIAYPIYDVVSVRADSGYPKPARYGDGNYLGYMWFWE